MENASLTGSLKSDGGESAPYSFPRLTLKKLLSIFCCPPLPSSIATKLAFTETKRSYSVQSPGHEENKVHRIRLRKSYLEMVGTQSGVLEKMLSLVNVHFVQSDSGNKICCAYFSLVREPKFTLLFSHGNAVDIGHICFYLVELGRELNVNIMTYDYSGYGLSSGKANEKNILHDVRAAYHFLKDQYKVTDDSLILYGQSIGSVPTTDLAAELTGLAGVVLHSPLSSGLRVLIHKLRSTPFFDVFANIKKVGKITAPTLFVHGVLDDLIPFEQASELYRLSNTKIDPLWLPFAGHNDVDNYIEYFERLQKFIWVELPRINHNSSDSAPAK